MAEPVSSTRASQRGARGVQSLIFIASFLLSAFLALGTLSVNRVLGVRTRVLGNGQGLVPYYLSVQGFLTLVPLDVALLAFAICVILVVVTLRLLAEAQLVVEDNPKRAQFLAAKAEKYIEWALYGVVFFATLQFSSALTSFFILFQDDLWVAFVLCAGVVFCVRVLVRKVDR